MHKYRFGAILSLALLWSASGAHAQGQIETYTYDELGRLIKVEVQGGAQNGDERVYTYDKADNRTQVVSTVASDTTPTSPSCMLSSVGWTTLQGSFGIARLFPPTPAGCGISVKLAFTISLESGTVTSQELQALQTSAFWIGPDTMGPTDFAKSMAIGPAATDVASTDPYVLRVSWTAVDGNATFFPPGYALVTVNPN